MFKLINLTDKKYIWICLSLIFLLHVFFRFYNLESNLFGWDQVDNAWAAKNIIVDHKFPLLGVPAKGSGGFFLGPAYYYLISVFYFFTNLDPIASPLFAGVTSIFTFFVYYFIFKKLFSEKIALIALLINALSIYVIETDRVQWNANFIAPISLIIFYCLYQISHREYKYFIVLGLTLGFSFHVHFTSIFYLPIILLFFPFIPWSKEIIKYITISILLFFAFFSLNIIADFSLRKNNSLSAFNYINTYYHGFHLTRVYQLVNDAFIEFESILLWKILKPLKFFILPAFIFIYTRNLSRSKIVLCYLFCLWFIIPWFGFSTYSGEISNYYFLITRPMVVMLLAYMTYSILQRKNMLLKLGIILFWGYYFYISVMNFSKFNASPSLHQSRIAVEEALRQNRIIEFVQGDPTSYLYYIYAEYKRDKK